jgi:Cu-Zn family superoxide dismutase
MRAIVLWERGSKKHSSLSKDDALDGFVLFYQRDQDHPVTVKLLLEGLPDGPHGFHIHEKGLEELELIDEDISCCDKLGGHFNVGEKWSSEIPSGTKHGHHTGDLCFNIISEDGKVEKTFIDHKISLFPGENCVLKRGLVIHEDEDDHGVGVYEDDAKDIESRKTGNAGKRLACGDIVLLLD